MHSNIHLKKTYLIHLLLIISCILAFFPQNTLCEDLKGRWVHYQRQAPQRDITGIFTLPDGKLWVATETSFNFCSWSSLIDFIAFWKLKLFPLILLWVFSVPSRLI